MLIKNISTRLIVWFTVVLSIGFASFLYAMSVLGTKQMIWVAVVVILLSSSLLFWLVRREFNPLRNVSVQTLAIISGEREQLDIPKGTEIAVLARQFNRLLAQNKNQQRELSGRQAYLDILLSTAPLGLFMTEQNGNIEYINPKMQQLTGYTLQELKEVGMRERISESDREGTLTSWQNAITERYATAIDFRFVTKSAAEKWLHLELQPVYSNAMFIGFAGSLRDATNEVKQLEELRTQANRDTLTGLLNRRGYDAAVQRTLTDARLFNESFQLMVVDLDEFKAVNDTAGHEAGDWVLQKVADIMREHTRDTDYCCRLGGDEFVVLLLNCPHRRAKEIAENIAADIERMHKEKNIVKVTASIGLTSLREDDEDEQDILRRADKAAYKAKHAGRNQIVIDS
ncbi:hypothetical protein CWE13_01730 [Aliidiomarina shirensis]|uniref:Sensor domain-containing diguanylate cyclase n=1 Tax=Aliidiomarina shirensis TaxID=1048642 RepID=A0A432WXD2_9GAMM|nr:sensor domain-containing diguanylate cyclase [Aliidiomarina shirensis]RUO38387.1 hypothetical protein CWE13_01730 [Aliidiomarina shirensis]